ncbi:hypothetical protein MYSTI_01762 [Myxococcus stipitatus DSM 14675]|uniref:Lipoprotein n=2 Tax=Myxococcus stipitatus TaxID=83455 RepID=L7U9F1_MYXSD|nr:hypothetical protein MYSTI_01762 [Myxococcus stipitatus DSM 14675]
MNAGTKWLAWALGAVLFQGCAGSRAVVPSETRSETNMTKHVKGPFDVKVKPMAPDAEPLAYPVGRMSIDKKYHGELEGTGSGQMLATMDENASGGYVALERVTGTLQGRKGSFVIQHSGLMARGVPTLVITVVPDSGTDELKGLTGTMMIHIDAQGKHTYEFDYALAETP